MFEYWNAFSKCEFLDITGLPPCPTPPAPPSCPGSPCAHAKVNNDGA